MPSGIGEKIYYKLPVFLQNCLFSAYGWNVSRKRYNRNFHESLSVLKETEWWSAAKIEAHQNAKVASIVAHAYKTVPFYKRWYDEHGIDIATIKTVSDLARLPVLTKQMVRENQQDMVSSVYNRQDLERCLTSGTTGTPLNVYFTREGMAYQWAIWWRHKARFGLTMKDRHLTFGARVPIDQNQSSPPYWRSDYCNNRTYLSTYHISKKTVGDIVEYINSTQFDFFTGNPAAMYVLASLIDEFDLQIDSRPRHIVTGADTLLPKHEAIMKKVFDAPVTEQYGMTEFAGNMSKCEYGKFHLDFECCYIEGFPKGEFGARSLVMTGWGNDAMPFIRYEVGDLGQRSDEACPCGRESLCFSSIEGRLEDYVVTPDGRKLIGMNQVFKFAENAKEIQIYQKSSSEVEFRVVPGKGFSDSDKEALAREFRRRGGNEMQINFSLVNELQRSSSGKLKAVVSDVK